MVYGSRFLGGPHRVLLFWQYVGNRLLTILSNMFTDLNPSNTDRMPIQSAPDENCFTTSSSGRNGRRILAVFEVKKEIPVYPWRPPDPVLRRVGIGLLLLVMSAFYILVAGVQGSYPEFYALLARNLLHGKTTLPVRPRPELLRLEDPYDPQANWMCRVHDASLYKGHYYLYFGVVPAVTLFVPYRIATGGDLRNRVAVPIFCIAGYWSSCALFFLIANHNRWALPLWLELAVVVSLGSMSLVGLLLRRPAVYEVAIAAGYFFVLSGFLALARAVLVERNVRKWLLLSGLLLGLAVGCRPHLVLICAIVLGALALRARRSPALVVAMATGMIVCGSALAWYNYVRFDNPLEFGRSYQLTQFPNNPGSSYHGLELNPELALQSAKEFLLLPPKVNLHPPFFHTVAINPLAAWPGTPFWLEETVGLIPAAPFALLGLFTPLFLSRRLTTLDEASVWLLKTMYWSTIAVLIILCTIGWVLGRYLVEIAPLLTLEGAVLLSMSMLAIREARLRFVFSCGVGAAAVYGVLVNSAFATSGLRTILKAGLK